jgi:hypothetical protein
MNKNQWTSLLVGAGLILIGATTFVGNVFLKVEAWKMWPLIVLLAGIGFTIPALFAIKKPGMAAFFFPAFPTLTTGIILMYASLTGNWGIWAIAWPLEIIAVALSFTFAAVFFREAGLAIPAAIIWANGLALGFCAVTGMWQAWALIWPIEPLSVGIGLLILSYFNRSHGTRVAGMILCAVAGGGFFIASFISIFNETVLRFAVPALLIFSGLIVVFFSFVKTKPEEAQAQTIQE